MKKLFIPFLLACVSALGQSYSNLQFDPTTGTVQTPVTTPTTTYPVTLAQFGIVDATLVLTTGSYVNPGWISSLGWSKITSTPTTLAGYGITDPIVVTSGSYSNPAWITALAWSKVTGTPTSAASYGIVNGANIDSVGTLGGASYYTNAANLSSGTLPTARFPAFTGDVTTTSGGVVTVLATVNASPSTYGTATQVAQITVNGKGLATTVTNVTITPAFSSITSTPTTLAGYGITDGVNSAVNDTNVTGSITGHALTLGWTGTLAAARLNANTPQSITNDTNVTGNISAQVLTLGWTGTLAAGRLNSSVVESVTNDTNITGSISGQALTLGWAGTLAAGRLNSNVVESVTNGTNVTGAISAQGLTLGWTGTLAIASGGTGASTAGTAFNALSPMTTLGDVIYGGASGAGTRLAGNTSSTRQFFSQTGNGTISAIPAWVALATTDIPTISLSTGVNGTLQAAQMPALTGDVTSAGATLSTTVGKINGVSLAGLVTGILKNTTATGVPSIAAAGTDYLGVTGGATITTVGTVGTGVWQGTAVATGYGGTGGASAAAGFNNLNPMTTTGDIIYEVSNGTSGRLAIGTTGQVLTVAGGVPSWASGGSGSGNVSNSGTPTNGQLALWTNATTIQGLTALPAANFPALTGDATTSAASLAVTVKGINGTLVSSLATGIYKNTTTTGAVSIAVAGTDYLAPFTSQTANYVYASPNGSSGTPSFRALAAADIPTISAATQLSGTLPAAQFGALTGDVTNTAGSYATTVGKIGGNAVSLGGALTFSGAYSFTATLTAATSVTFPTSGTLLTSTTGVSSITGTANQITASGSVGAVTLSLPTAISGVTTIGLTGAETSTLAGIAVTSTDGEVLTNTTAGTSGTPSQWSPRLRLTGQMWNPNASANQESDWIVENEATGGLGAPTYAQGALTFGYQVAGGGYTKVMQLTSLGLLSITNGASITLSGTNVNGSPLGSMLYLNDTSIGNQDAIALVNQWTGGTGGTLYGAYFNMGAITGSATGLTVADLYLGGQVVSGSALGTSAAIIIADFTGTAFTNHYGIDQVGTSPNLFAGSITENAPSATIGLTINAVANSYGEKVLGSSTSGQSLGLEILAGTTSADSAFLVQNQAGSSTFFSITGNGCVGIGGAPVSTVALDIASNISGNGLNGINLAETLSPQGNGYLFSTINSAPTIATSTFTGLGYYGVALGTPTKTGSGTISFAAQLYISQGVSATVGYGIDQVGTDQNYFGGQVAANHFYGQSSATIAAGTGAGTSPTVSVSGNDTDGVITVVTGSAPTAAATVFTLSYGTSYSSNNVVGNANPIPTLTPASSTSAALSSTTQVYPATLGAGSFTVSAGSAALSASTTYIWTYHVLH
jgi:hypothetical protein